MKKSYTQTSKELPPKKHFYMITGRVDNGETNWVHEDDVPVLKTIKSKQRYYDGQSMATAGMLKEALEINGIKGTKSEVGNIYKMFDNMQVILKGEEVHAMQFGALGKYVTAYLDATQIHHGKLPDGFAPDGTWYKNENGVYVRDMKKVAELIL
jgi:hypothetical protein